MRQESQISGSAIGRTAGQRLAEDRETLLFSRLLVKLIDVELDVRHSNVMRTIDAITENG